LDSNTNGFVYILAPLSVYFAGHLRIFLETPLIEVLGVLHRRRAAVPGTASSSSSSSSSSVPPTPSSSTHQRERQTDEQVNESAGPSGDEEGSEEEEEDERAALEAMTDAALRARAVSLLRESNRRALSIKWTAKGLTHEGGGSGGGGGAEGEVSDEEEEEDPFEDTDAAAAAVAALNVSSRSSTAQTAAEPSSSTELDDALLEAAVDRLLTCSGVVGMHPDQAAEPIVDLALALGKPFALVPCCVYSDEFPKRRLRDGRLVHKYEELLEYLREKDGGRGRIRDAKMPMEGRNVCLYSAGDGAIV
jgi:hypothetical protein